MSKHANYLVITPCRDEARYARRTLDSMVHQTVLPRLWLLVDDGSSDATPQILAEYAVSHPWLRVMRREDRGARSVGPGVIEAFYTGLASVDLEAFDYLCKLDLDLDLPYDYFERLIQKMENEPRLGTCSGKAWFSTSSGKLVEECSGDEMSVGMTKFYRRECFQEIGGFVRAVMWDGIDCHRCRMLGWTARSFDELPLRFVHLRPMGSSHKSLWTGRLRHGRGQYFMGTGFGYMTVSALFRATKQPFVIGGAGIWLGWLQAFLSRAPRYEDHEFRIFLHRFHRECLLFGKRRAMQRCAERLQAVWDARKSSPTWLESTS